MSEPIVQPLPDNNSDDVAGGEPLVQELPQADSSEPLAQEQPSVDPVMTGKGRKAEAHCPFCGAPAPCTAHRAGG